MIIRNCLQLLQQLSHIEELIKEVNDSTNTFENSEQEAILKEIISKHLNNDQ